MTLDEAIKHAEEVAEKNEKKASWFWGKEGNPNYENCVKCAEEHRQLAEWLKELKQLRMQTRWIPISERLPEVADCYAVTEQIGSDLIVKACYFDGINNWNNDNWINDKRNYLTDIVAWMPLSEAYKAEEDKE